MISAPGRIQGIDVARGLAVFGMFGAHVSLFQRFDWATPSSWADVVNGRSSILFALLAGVSLAILSGSTRPVSGANLSRARLRIALRAGVVLAIGLLLVALGTNIAIILPYYAVLFLLALPMLVWPPRVLWATAAVMAVVGPLATSLLISLAVNSPTPWDDILLIVPATGPYPILIWIVFVLVGLGVGRLDLTALRVQVRLLGFGAGIAALGYGLGVWVASLTPARGLPFEWSDFATIDAHSGSPFEIVGSTGFALAVLGLCLLASRVIPILLVPIAAVGSMALSAYTGQVVAIALLRIPVPGVEFNGTWLILVLVTAVVATLWSIVIGRGPLERLLHWLTTGAGRRPPADRLETAVPAKENSEL